MASCQTRDSLKSKLRYFIPIRARWISVVKSDLGDINDRASCTARSNGDHGLEDVSEVASNVFAARLIGSEAKGATLAGALRAVTPTNWSLALGIVLAGRVAKPSIILLIRLTCQGRARCPSIAILSARDANVSHAIRAVGRADTAAHVVEVVAALWIPQAPILLTTVALVNLASASAVGFGLVAESTVVAEVIWAVLPADWSHTIVTVSAQWVAQETVLLLVSGARRDRLAHAASIGLHPARLNVVTCNNRLRISRLFFSDHHTDFNADLLASSQGCTKSKDGKRLHFFMFWYLI